MANDKLLSMRMPASLYEAIEDEAERTRRKVSAVIREAIRNGLREKKSISAAMVYEARGADVVGSTNQRVL